MDRWVDDVRDWPKLEFQGKSKNKAIFDAIASVFFIVPAQVNNELKNFSPNCYDVTRKYSIFFSLK